MMLLPIADGPTPVLSPDTIIGPEFLELRRC